MFGEPTAICADVRTSISEVTLRDGTRLPVTADDTSVLLLRMASGALVELSSSVVAHTPRDGASKSSAPKERRGYQRTRRQQPAHRPRRRLPRTSRPGIAEREVLSGALFADRGATVSVKAQTLMLEDWLRRYVTSSPAQFRPSAARGEPNEVIDGQRLPRSGDAHPRGACSGEPSPQFGLGPLEGPKVAAVGPWSVRKSKLLCRS